VRRALEIPLGSLESEIDWLYHKHGRLAKVLCDARALVEKSRGETPQEPSSAAAAAATAAAAAAVAASASGAGDRDREPAVPRLTAGGIITLEWTLAKLEALQWSPP
jgi:ubiquitin-conjugating enzyme E2 O